MRTILSLTGIFRMKRLDCLCDLGIWSCICKSVKGILGISADWRVKGREMVKDE